MQDVMLGEQFTHRLVKQPKALFLMIRLHHLHLGPITNDPDIG